MRIYRRVVRLLKEKFAPKYPVEVRRVRLPVNLDGDCRFRNDKFHIRINRELPEHEAIETLLHEFAHTHAWDCSYEMHSDEWGKAYSRIYRIFLKEVLEKTL